MKEFDAVCSRSQDRRLVHRLNTKMGCWCVSLDRGATALWGEDVTRTLPPLGIFQKHCPAHPNFLRCAARYLSPATHLYACAKSRRFWAKDLQEPTQCRRWFPSPEGQQCYSCKRAFFVRVQFAANSWQGHHRHKDNSTISPRLGFRVSPR